MRRMRFVRREGANPYYDDNAAWVIHHVVAVNNDNSNVIWLSPMGACSFDEHPYMRDALLPHIVAMQQARANRSRAASSSIEVAPGMDPAVSPSSRRPRTFSFTRSFSARQVTSAEVDSSLAGRQRPRRMSWFGGR
eukprot:CAMPEP_0181168390 /NCGR_PEP_ID=MMETSP1096-20121128/246_1 /TAXON_ID=156174 ORGANISM="Chrysochromulina ericina, Strain CCMP281" /NCGR_SAMPLE_ID=MMETSP1096 /ASSEMBLY_ACC=CAM_ASM_000453 /LENGTH=135 /DNA_ID=CAMNT_0023255759 /DNA_START=239 /DNA_END=646 /DNA_ORIENTATION=+